MLNPVISPTIPNTQTTPQNPSNQILRFGNDVVVNTPGVSTGVGAQKDYSVLDSSAAQADYYNKLNFANQESLNIQNQSIANQLKTASQSQEDTALKSNNELTGAIKEATKSLSGQPIVNEQVNALEQQNKEISNMYLQTKEKLAVAASSAGLSVSQQQQISSLAQQFDTIIKQQEEVNKGYTGGIKMNTFRSGTDRYANEIAMGEVQKSVNDGLVKIADLTNKKNSAILSMQQGFEDSNVKAVTESYNMWKDANTMLTNNLKEINNTLAEAQKAQTDALNFQYKVYQDNLQLQKDARDFAYKNNIVSQAYQIGSRIYDTATGQELDPSSVAPGSVQVIDPNSKASAEYVSNLSSKYGDTVFPTMTPEQAQKAMQYSKIYREQTRPPQYITNPSDGSNKLDFKFVPGDVGQLISAGFSNANIPQLEADLRKYTLDQVVKDMPDKQKKALELIVGGATYTQQIKNETIKESKLTRQNLSKLFSIPDNNEKDTILGFDHGKTNAEKLNEIMDNISKFQNVGLSDAEILKKLE